MAQSSQRVPGFEQQRSVELAVLKGKEGSHDAKPEMSVKEWEEWQKWEKVDVVAIAIDVVTSFPRRHPVLAGLWAFGLFLVAFAGGLPVGGTAQESYSVMFQLSEVVDSRDLGHSIEELEVLEASLYHKRGWFGACNDECQKLQDKVQMARQEVARTQKHRDEVLSQARQEVGIWSTYGVQDVRKSFWKAWKSGKDFASRCTMYDAFFMMAGKEETMYSLIFKLIIQYVINLTIGLFGAFFYFVYNVYTLLVSYGSSFLSGLAFLLLALIAGLSMIGTYLGIMYGAVAGGGVMLMQHAAKQAALESGSRQGRGPPKMLRSGPKRAPQCPV